MKLSLPAAVTTRVAHQSLILQKSSPKVLFYVGLGLMGGTIVSACKATLELSDTLDDIKQDRDDIVRANNENPGRWTEREISRLNYYITVRGGLRVLKLYLPAMALGVAAVACLTSSHNQLQRRNAGLSAALAATDRALKDYRARVVDELGEDKDREFMFGKEEQTVTVEDSKGNKKQVKRVVAAGQSQYARVWGRDTSNEWDPHSEYNLAKLRSVQEWGTLMLNSRGHLMLNEIHDELGLSRTPAGQVVGWLSKKYGGNDGYVDFGVIGREGEEQLRFIDFMTGQEDHILLDFNVDGEIWRKI